MGWALDVELAGFADGLLVTGMEQKQIMDLAS